MGCGGGQLASGRLPSLPVARPSAIASDRPLSRPPASLVYILLLEPPFCLRVWRLSSATGVFPMAGGRDPQAEGTTGLLFTPSALGCAPVPAGGGAAAAAAARHARAHRRGRWALWEACAPHPPDSTARSGVAATASSSDPVPATAPPAAPTVANDDRDRTGVDHLGHCSVSCSVYQHAIGRRLVASSSAPTLHIGRLQQPNVHTLPWKRGSTNARRRVGCASSRRTASSQTDKIPIWRSRSCPPPLGAPRLCTHSSHAAAGHSRCQRVVAADTANAQATLLLSVCPPATTRVAAFPHPSARPMGRHARIDWRDTGRDIQPG